MKWTTAESEVISFENITHQHWSNIYWYHLIFRDIPNMAVKRMESISMTAIMELNKRFKGEILPYSPAYSYEIEWLEQLQLLRGNFIFNKKGIIIGEINPEKVKPFNLYSV